MSQPAEFVFVKAAPIREENIPGMVLRITAELPPYTDLPSAEQFYRDQAAGICEALYLSLPQGTFDRLVMELMAKKVSLYRGRTE